MTTPDDHLVGNYDLSSGSGNFVTSLAPYSLATEGGGGAVLLTSVGGVFGSLYRLDIASGLPTKILGHFPGADISVLPSGTQALLCWPSFSGIPGDLIQVDLGAINRFVFIAQRLGASAEANGTTMPHRPPFDPPTGLCSFRMISCKKRRAVSAVCLSSGKFERMPLSSSPPKGGFVMITSTRSLSPISRSGKRSALPTY